MPARSLTLTEASDLRYLDAKALRFLRHGAALRLTLGDERSYLSVSVVRMFPLSDPARYLTLRDGANQEIGVLVEPSGLDAEGRRLVAEELERRYVVPVIRRVRGVRERFGTLDWEVETDRGARAFTTRNLRETVVMPAPGRYLITDVDGNRYDLPDIAALDAISQALVTRYV